jgi:hypothetical protein
MTGMSCPRTATGGRWDGPTVQPATNMARQTIAAATA